MKKLYILAPNDRFNYGDLLFSHILKFYLEKKVDECIFVSTTESDLSKKGGLPTKSFHELYKANPSDENILIVAGGESLLISWFLILSYVDPSLDRLFHFLKKIHLRKILGNFLQKLMQHRLGYKTLYPFSIGKNELPAFSKVVYNSLGKCSLAKNPHLLKEPKNLEILRSVDYFGVRDKLTCKALHDAGVDCNLYPDSAILMSRVFSEQFLLDSLSIDDKQYEEKQYIFFQTSPLGVENEEIAASQLSEVWEKYGKKIVLCSIGTALGHNNQIVLKHIFERMPEDSAVFIAEPNVWDIMWLIKHSALYVGTSLHGTITAMSFGVPFAVHGQPKVKTYIETWSSEMVDFYTEFDGLFSNVKSQLEHPRIVDIEHQLIAIDESLNNMRNLIE